MAIKRLCPKESCPNCGGTRCTVRTDGTGYCKTAKFDWQTVNHLNLKDYEAAGTFDEIHRLLSVILHELRVVSEKIPPTAHPARKSSSRR
jgi:hypothetical protein